MKKKIYTFIKNILVLLIIGVPQLYLVIKDKPWQVNMITLISTTIILVLWNLEKITELTLKKDGVSIRLKQAVEEAYATIDLLKNVMEPMIKLQVDLIKNDGTFNSMSTERYIEVINELRNSSKALELDDDVIELVDQSWDRVVIQAKSDLYTLFAQNFEEEVFDFRLKVQDDPEKELNELKALSDQIEDEADREKWKFLLSIMNQKNK